MKALVALILLVQIAVYQANAHGPKPIGPSPPLGLRDCDSSEGEEAAEVAMDYINTHHKHGYKYALNRIEELRVLPRRPASEVVILELDLLETKCHVLNPLPLENCTVRELINHAIEADCDVKLLKEDGKLSVTGARCHSSPDSAEDIIKICPDCPLLIPLNDTQVVKTVELLLDQYHSTNDAYFMLIEIARAQMQVYKKHPAPVSYKLQVTEHAYLTDVSLFQSEVAHPVLAKDNVGLLPAVVQGFSHHNLRHSHSSQFNDSSESNSAEVPVAATLSAKLVVKRTVSEPTAEHPGDVLHPPPPQCPGRIRHFHI
uniref:Alpha 2-HS glycoprotein n=1 Tax=Crocodylus porosus TaxID=8502 RepID=A0A7M4FXY9_CROPO